LFAGATSVTTLTASGNVTLSGASANIAAGTTTTAGSLSNSTLSSYVLVYGATNATYPDQVQITTGASSHRFASTGLSVTGAITTNGGAFTINSSSGADGTLSRPTADASPFALIFDKDRAGAAVQNADGLGVIYFRGYDGTNDLYTAGIEAIVSGAVSAGVIPTDLKFTTGSSNFPSEKMRLDASGNLLVGATATVNAAKSYFGFTSANNGVYIADTTGVSNAQFMRFDTAASVVCGQITRVGTTSAVVYTATSDYRLKTVTGAVTGQGARIDALKPVDYQWKENNSQARGFLAHEFQTVYPNSVSGEKDAEDEDGNPAYQAMQASTSEVIADLVAELQSLRSRVALLEAK